MNYYVTSSLYCILSLLKNPQIHYIIFTNTWKKRQHGLSLFWVQNFAPGCTSSLGCTLIITSIALQSVYLITTIYILYTCIYIWFSIVLFLHFPWVFVQLNMILESIYISLPLGLRVFLCVHSLWTKANCRKFTSSMSKSIWIYGPRMRFIRSSLSVIIKS